MSARKRAQEAWGLHSDTDWGWLQGIALASLYSIHADELQSCWPGPYPEAPNTTKLQCT